MEDILVAGLVLALVLGGMVVATPGYADDTDPTADVSVDAGRKSFYTGQSLNEVLR